MAANAGYTKERLREITSSIESGIRDIFQSEKYFQYLRTMSRFHKYSVNNTVLIHMQKPNATLVAGFQAWKKNFKRNVKKGEHGITILAPTPFKKKIEKEKLDPDTRLPMLDADGKVIIEEKTIEIPYYKPVKVFDVSQTVGEPLPSLVTDLTGDVQQYEVFMEALKRSSPVPISIEQISGNMDGYFSTDKQSITLREGMSQVQTVCAAIHEIAHSILHNEKRLQEVAAATGEPVQKKDRNTEEVEAESISYSVLAYYGIDTGANSLGYILEWSKSQELSELRASLETIRKTSSSLITDIDHNFDAICKERGIDRSVEPEMRAESDTPDRFAVDFCTFVDRAFQEGAVKKPLVDTSPKYESGVADLIRHGMFDGIEQTLTEASVTHYDITTVNSLLNRLNHLREEWQASIVYKKEDYGLSTGEHNRSCIHEYEQKEDALESRKIVFVGSDALCQELTDKLNAHSISVEKVLAMEREEPVEQDAQEVSQEQPDDSLPAQPELERTEPEPTPEPAEQELPDPAISIESMNAYGYVSEDMLPLTKDRAREIFEHGGSVFMLYEGNSEGMVFEPEDIDMHTGIFGIPRDDWEEIKDKVPSPQIQDKTQEVKAPERPDAEATFRDNPSDCFLIYQLKNDESTYGIAFETFAWMQQHDKAISYANYDAVYTGPLPDCEGVDAKLEQLFETFNIAHPADFTGHSLSISDIVAIKQDGEVSCYYVDNIGFTRLPEFLPAENYLRSAEMSLEDDCNMIDGIINNGPKQPTVADLEQQVKSGQSISLMDLAAAQKRENEAQKKPNTKGRKQPPTTKEPPKKTRKPSVLAKLRSYQNMEKQQAIERKSAERGL